MIQSRLHFGSVAILHLLLALPFVVTAQQQTGRVLRPEDLFRFQSITATSWASNGRYVAIEISNSSRSLDRNLPSGEIRLLDVRDRSLRQVSPKSDAYLGFFNATWSPNGERLAFLSLDREANVRLWIWTVGSKAPVMLPDLDLYVGNNEPAFVWIDNDRVAALAWEAGAEKRGLLYFRVFRGRNVVKSWQKAFDGQEASVSVVESGGAPKEPALRSRLITVDLRTNKRHDLARGSIHRLSVSTDGRAISFLRESPGLPSQPVSSYINRNTDEDGYAAVNWGTDRHVIDAVTGAELPLSTMPEKKSAPPSGPTISLPRPDARRLSTSSAGDAALFLANASDGSHLLLVGGAGRPLTSSSEVWIANQWMSGIRTGKAQSISYTALDGSSQTAWLLLPPGYVAETKLPLITIVYPGLVFGARTPSSFSAYDSNFEHPQLFAALGYAVLLPSMPEPKDPRDSHNLTMLPNGVLPAVDAVIAKGFVDPDRVAVLGQSDGGFTVQGLLTQTKRFRSAIASAGFSDLVSLYGTFYGQFRHGDGGIPEAGQVFRIIQMEKGAMNLGGPPWAEAERYRANSAVLHADKITTPLMLVHGEFDFIPIQQDEELFTMLYRQDKRVTLVRYQGEWHTITQRANVIDLWQRMESWLKETMAARE
jgi:dipeptidyl aminopeptidase/acylaminoacyl peptidase